MSTDYSKEIFKVPITPYDIYGYLLPGSFIMLCCFFIYKQDTFQYSLFSLAIGQTIALLFTPPSSDIVTMVVRLFALLLLSYIVGHINATISSLFFDKLLINKGHGYPYEFYLNLPEYRQGLLSKFIRGAFFWFTMSLILLIVRSFLNPQNNWKRSIDNFFCFIFAFFITAMFSFIVLKFTPESRSFYKYLEMFTGFWYKLHDILLNVYSKIMRTKEPFDDIFIAKYKQNFNGLFGLETGNSKTNNFWLAYLHVSHKSKHSASLLSNWFFLFSFSRNISTAFLLLFLLTQAMIHLESGSIEILPILSVVFFLGFIIMLMRFNYLYKNYFTKYLFRSFVYVNSCAYNDNLDSIPENKVNANLVNEPERSKNS